MNYLELLLALGAERGAADRNAWPPTLPPVLAADASPTEPRVNTPAASVTIASFANCFSFLLYEKQSNTPKDYPQCHHLC